MGLRLDQTVEQIEAQARVRAIALQRARRRNAGGRISRRRRPVPRARLPVGIMRDYFRALQPFINDLLRLTRTELIPALIQGTDENLAVQPTTDSARLDQVGQERIVETIGGMRTSFFREWTDVELKAITDKFAGQTNAWNQREFKKQVKAVLGIDIFATEGFLPSTLTSWSIENVGLIKTIAEKYFVDIERVTSSGFRQGLRANEIAKQLPAKGRTARFNAKRIARDQTNKLNGQLNRLRQTNIGIERYTWKTLGDDRVRDEHEGLDGQIFSWDSPPPEGHPGEPIQCRCTAEPIFDDILDDVEAVT